MKLQELLAIKGINSERTKLIRHNMSNEEIATYYSKGQIDKHTNNLNALFQIQEL